MALASAGVTVVEQTPQNGCSKCLCLKGESQLPPASPEGSPRSASGLTQTLFKLLPL